ncbi:uncharacterized protein BDZ99DRAFT_517121 [Mytilinidion resinicola]|uniref:Uncharacterized protein n=1 Tax=Mytilinidion resinicola TaxID=574789 RepID=A0A6A6YWB3_9PEZI|nr:uncharacterized protein BDZ99DRAFT_517121 [Mytilinidion resinicola]KAF2812809.1 hypothetical protein BDZ99DRAFT_517121 [Mytilinidion resinicola]
MDDSVFMLIRDATGFMEYLIKEAWRIPAVGGEPRRSRRHSNSARAQEKEMSQADLEQFFEKITSTTENLKARYFKLKSQASADSNHVENSLDDAHPTEDTNSEDNALRLDNTHLSDNHAKKTHSEDNSFSNAHLTEDT